MLAISANASKGNRKVVEFVDAAATATTTAAAATTTTGTTAAAVTIVKAVAAEKTVTNDWYNN